jgi:hypothetical protein
MIASTLVSIGTTALGNSYRDYDALLTDNAADRGRIDRGDFRLDHLSCDWSLNGRHNGG